MTLFDYGNQPYKITKPIRLIELFAGIGAQAKALENLGANFEHYRICEFDKYAVKSYNAVHGTDFDTSDITKITAEDLGIIDTDQYEYIMTYSFPCQDLSNAGKQAGMTKGSDTRSGLLWEVERLLNECTELPQILLMENVPQVHGKKNIADFNRWLDFLESKGYSNYWQDLNAKNFGVPQNRNRCFMISILGNYSYEFPKGIELERHLCDMLEDEVDEKYYLSDKMLDYIVSKDDKYIVSESNVTVNKKIACAVTTREGQTRADASNYIAKELPEDYNLLNNEINIVGKSRSGGERSLILGTNGICNCLSATDYKQPKQILIKNATKQGYTEAEPGDGIDLAYPDSKTRRGRVQKQMSHTVTTEDHLAVVEPHIKSRNKRLHSLANKMDLSEDNQFMDAYNQRTSKVAGTITTGVDFRNETFMYHNYRIRKLTPKECWRLMGFYDTDFDKAQQTNSNTQLYKQAGNSIVVDVLMAIFKELL